MNKLSLLLISILAVCAWIIAGCGGQTYSPTLGVTGNFNITGSAPQTSTPGGSVTFTISSSAFVNQARTQSEDRISLSVLSGLPSGATGTLNPTSVVPGANTTLTVQTVEDTAPRNYDIVVQGTFKGVSKTATVRLTIDSTFVVNGGGTQTVQPGGTASYNLIPATTSNEDRPRGPNDVTFVVTSGLPTGATATFDPALVALDATGTLEIATSNSTPLGTYEVLVTATWGTKTATKTVTLVVTAPDFFLSSPSTLFMSAGETREITISVLSGAEMSRGVDDVQLSLVGTVPTGFTAVLSDTTVTIGGQTTLTVTYPLPSKSRGIEDTVTGVFTVQGTNGVFTRTTVTSVTVNLFPGGG